MSPRFYNIILCILFSANVFAQVNLSGRVLNDVDGAPMAGASVYLNNTSIGAITDDQGFFTLTNVISGELIVSSIGCQRIIFKFDIADIQTKFFVFRMQVKPSTLRDVLVLSRDQRQRFLKLFRDHFLGITEEAASTQIVNTDAINFSAARERNAFIAYTDTPLTIINRKLGYIIRFDLAEFYLNEVTGETFFYGFTRYEEMGDKKRWLANRRHVYYGSSTHFLRSLVHDKLEKEGYKIAMLKPDTVKAGGAGIPGIKDRIVNTATWVKASQLLTRDSATNKFLADWPGSLMVQYSKDPANKYYLSNKVFLPNIGGASRGARSYLKLTDGAVRIDNNGILENPLLIYFSGYWAYEKAANLLPNNYDPENE